MKGHLNLRDIKHMPSSLAYPHIMSEWTLLQPLSFDCFFLGSECVLLQYPSTLGPPVAQDPFSICFHQFNFHEERSIFTLFPHLPLATKLLSTVTPKVLVLILLNYSGPLTLWVSPPQDTVSPASDPFLYFFQSSCTRLIPPHCHASARYLL